MKEELDSEQVVFKLVYHFCKVRGPKVIVRFFAHEVPDLIPVLSYMELHSASPSCHWHFRYVLLTWLSLVIRLPFDLARFDDDGQRDLIVERLMALGFTYIKSAGAERDASAEFMARLFSRSEFTEQLLLKTLDMFFQHLSSSEPDAFFVPSMYN